MSQIHEVAPGRVFELLHSRSEGLTADEAAERLRELGKNTLGAPVRFRLIRSLFRQLTNFFSLLLDVAAGLCFVADAMQPGERMNVLGWALLGVSLLNALFAFFQEYRAERAMQALAQFLPPRLALRRGGHELEMLAEDVVPGDVLLIREGDRISADARLIECNELLVNNAPLTGESAAVALTEAAESGRLIDSSNIVFAGCSVLKGSGVAVVFATGERTQFGKVAALSRDIRRPASPLERQTTHMVRVLTAIAVTMGVGFFTYGVFAGRPLWVNLVFMLGIIVANVPEGLLPTFEGVDVLLGRALKSVEMNGNRVLSICMETDETIRAAMFVDATYEGDLLAAANVSYRVGREPASAYGESLAGQFQNVSWSNVYQFCRLPLSPYVEPGNPESGLLPEISSEPPGNVGDGDFKVQAYNFRVFLTDRAGKIAFPKPRGYDPGRYACSARFLNADPRIRWTLDYTTRPLTDGPVQVRVGDSNNAGSFSSDYVGGNYRWPDGTYEPGSFTELPAARRGLPVPLSELYDLRERIFQDHVCYQQGLMYFLANDPRVPAELRDRVNRFGLDPNEFQDTGHWPHQLYVREGRRMVSEYVVTQEDCESKRNVDDSVGLASYAMDSHFCQRVVVKEDGNTTVRNEGGFGHGCPRPYPVSYRSIVPKKEECDNLLVPVCLSSSHVAYGSIRMEPVFMILGQSAGTAAALAIEEGVAVQNLDYGKLKARLEKGRATSRMAGARGRTGEAASGPGDG